MGEANITDSQDLRNERAKLERTRMILGHADFADLADFLRRPRIDTD